MCTIRPNFKLSNPLSTGALALSRAAASDNAVKRQQTPCQACISSIACSSRLFTACVVRPKQRVPALAHASRAGAAQTQRAGARRRCTLPPPSLLSAAQSTQCQHTYVSREHDGCACCLLPSGGFSCFCFWVCGKVNAYRFPPVGTPKPQRQIHNFGMKLEKRCKWKLKVASSAPLLEAAVLRVACRPSSH